MSDDDESDAAYNRRMFSDEAQAWRKSDCDEQAAWEAERHTATVKAERVYFASNPWPTDLTALRGHRMGLQEFIRERGD